MPDLRTWKENLEVLYSTVIVNGLIELCTIFETELIVRCKYFQSKEIQQYRGNEDLTILLGHVHINQQI